MLYRIVPVIVISLSTFILGQTAYISAGLTAQYGNGVLPDIGIGSSGRELYIYSEHFFDVTAGYDNFSLWSSFEFSFPPQIGPDHLGLRKLRLTWEGDNYSFSAGDLYGQIGRGLGLNLWESQGIDWDSSLRGIWFNMWISERLTLDLISGKVRGGRHFPQGPGVDPRQRDFNDDATVNTISISKDIGENGSRVGGYFVAVNAVNPWFDKREYFFSGEFEVIDSTSIRTRSKIPGFFLEYFGDTYDFYLEMIRRDHEIIDADSLYSSTQGKWHYYEKESKGWGGYASFSFYPGRFGITVEYKDYLLDQSNPDIRQKLSYRLGRRSPVQSPPTLFREHTSTLLSRTPHIMDFEDETGLQIELNYELNNDLLFTFNYSHSNRHTSFIKVIHPDFSSEWKKSQNTKLLNKEMYYPFREIFGEVNYHYRPINLDLIAAVSSASDVLSFNKSLTEKSGSSGWLASHSKEILNWEKRNLLSVPIQLTFGLPSGLGFTIYWEHQWENLEFRSRIMFRDSTTSLVDSVTSNSTTSIPYYYRYISLSIGKPSKYSFGIVYDYASQVKTGQPQNIKSFDDSWLEGLIRSLGVDLTNKWFGLQFNVYLTPSTLLSVFYGSLQGGLKCDSGVCVYVPGIEDALTLTLTSNF